MIRRIHLRFSVLAATLIAALAYPILIRTGAAQRIQGVLLEDIFGRSINDKGLILVDWEGYIANPAIKFYVLPPADAAFPASAILSSNEPLLYFDLPSTFGASGPRKTITFADATDRVPVLISVFPDRGTVDKDRVLTVDFTDARGDRSSLSVNTRIIDQDGVGGSPFQVTIDFTYDQTGFFNDQQKRAIIRQAAEDWAYFIGDMNLDLVAAGAEETFIWDRSGFITGRFVTNRDPYTGFLLYAYGIDQAEPPYRSGGEPSLTGGFQSSVGNPLPIKRSGGVEIEIKGNFNLLGWFLTTGDTDWWVSGNLGDERNDLYSIAHHEIGHSLFFNPAHTLFGEHKAAGEVRDDQVLAYHGSYPQVDEFDHFPGAVDRMSRRGAFGYEYFGDVPRRRWLITKLDLLNAQAVGYQLRLTSAFIPVSITTEELPSGAVGVPYASQMRAAGGVPFYHWTVKEGDLPPGLLLNPFTGVIEGVPTLGGTFSFTIGVRDYDEVGSAVTKPMTITISN